MKSFDRKEMSPIFLIGLIAFIVLGSAGVLLKVYFRSGQSEETVGPYLIIAIVVGTGIAIKFFLDYLKSKKPYISIADNCLTINNKGLGSAFTYKVDGVSSIRVHNEEKRASIKVETTSGENDFIQFSENLDVPSIVNFIRENTTIDAAKWE